MITKFSGNNLWFVSDTHFNHNSILKFCNRPFETIEEHDQKLIENWNSVVGSEDTVFHLGDFCFGGAPKWKEIRSQLNGHIILIVGNHDQKNRTAGTDLLFDYVTQQMRIEIDGRTVYLNHFPFLTFAHWNPEIYKDNIAYALSGHTHISKTSTTDDMRFLDMYLPTQYDVGVDFNNYTPISWEEINNKIQYQVNNNCNLKHWL